MKGFPELDVSWGEAVLKCPCCGGMNLHHGRIKDFYRQREDDELVDMTIVNNGVSATHRVPSQGSGNPSSRRDGLTIEFSCEECDGKTFTLSISQHKGSTYLRWEPIASRAPHAPP